MWQAIGSLLAGGGPWAALTLVTGLVLYCLVFGLLIPVRTHEREILALERQVKAEERRGDEYRQQVLILLGEHAPSRAKPGLMP